MKTKSIRFLITSIPYMPACLSNKCYHFQFLFDILILVVNSGPTNQRERDIKIFNYVIVIVELECTMSYSSVPLHCFDRLLKIMKLSNPSGKCVLIAGDSKAAFNYIMTSC